jgi:hypothetical protein
VRATTIGGSIGLYAFKIEICGAENIASIIGTFINPLPPFYHYYYGMQGFVVDSLPNEGDVRPYFTNDNAACPIVAYDIQQESPVGSGTFVNFATFASNVPDTYIGGGFNHRTHSILNWASFDYPDLYVTAITKAGRLARYNFRVKVCGGENLIYDPLA